MSEMILDLGEDARWIELERLAGRLILAGDERRLLSSFRERLSAARQVLHRAGEAALPRHAVAEALAPLTAEELLLLMAETAEPARSCVRRDLTELWRGGGYVSMSMDPKSFGDGAEGRLVRKLVDDEAQGQQAQPGERPAPAAQVGAVVGAFGRFFHRASAACPPNHSTR